MNPENLSKINSIYGKSGVVERRSSHRLGDDLWIREPGAEQILQLRGQISELQSHICQLEAELKTLRISKSLLLAQLKEGFNEATWIELGYSNGAE